MYKPSTATVSLTKETWQSRSQLQYRSLLQKRPTLSNFYYKKDLNWFSLFHKRDLAMCVDLTIWVHDYNAGLFCKRDRYSRIVQKIHGKISQCLFTTEIWQHQFSFAKDVNTLGLFCKRDLHYHFSSTKVTWIVQSFFGKNPDYTSRVWMLLRATHCNTLQHTVTQCNTLQHYVSLV